MEDMKTLEYLRIGIIATTHGIKGEVKVSPTTDDMKRFLALSCCYLDTGKEKIELEVEGVKFFKKYAILKFKQFHTIEDVEKYKGKDLLVDREHAVDLAEDEYFIADLIGMSVAEEDGRQIGILKDVLQTGANDVFIVEDEQGKEILLPYIDECILEVDMQKRRITAFLMPGLI